MDNHNHNQRQNAERDDAASVVDTLTKTYHSFSPVERKVANQIISNPDEAIQLNVSRLAERCDVSDAAVVRTAQRAGYSGYYQMRIMLLRDLRQDSAPKESAPDDDPIGYSFEKDMLFLKTLSTAETSGVLANVADIILDSPCIYVAACGNTLPLAFDLEFRLNRLGIRSFSAAVPEQRLNYLANATDADVLVAISRSGAAVDLLSDVQTARDRNMRVVAITGADVSPLTKMATLSVVTGSIESIFERTAPRVETHIAELFVLDALVFKIDMALRHRHGDQDVELDIADFKL